MSDETAPVACTLTTKQLAARRLDWADLHRHAVSVVAVPRGAAVMLPGSLAPDVARLVAAERRCCAFLTITTERIDGLVRLEITSENPDGRPIAAALAGLRPG